MSIPLFKVRMNEELAVNELEKTINSGMITQSSKVEEFEALLKSYFNYPYILTLNSATSGLTLAYRLLNVDPKKDIVISTPLTCFATNTAILSHNLKIVWADTDLKTGNIDLDDVKHKLTEKTTILTFVHWGGSPVDLDKVEQLKQYAKEKYNTNLQVIEDCAHAFGSTYYGEKLGTFYNNICVFSLQAIKHLTTGDGGLIFLPNQEMYDRAKLLRWYGIDRNRRSLPGQDFRLEPDIPEYGYKFHMNDINASIGIANMYNIDFYLNKCKMHGAYYNSQLKNIKGLQLLETNFGDPCYWIYTFRILNNRKNEFMNYMSDNNIVVSQVHARNDKHSCVSKYFSKLPNLDIIENEIISIPVGWWLEFDDIKFIIQCIKKFLSMEIKQLNETELYEYKILLSQLNNVYLDGNEDIDFENIYVLKVDGKIISIAKLYVEKKLYDPVGHIEDVVTHINYRQKGYGKYLIKYITSKAINDFGCYKVVLNAKKNLSNFYKSCGFEIAGYQFIKRA